MPIGRYRGFPMAKLPLDYLHWLMNLQDASADIRDRCWQEVRRRRSRVKKRA